MADSAQTVGLKYSTIGSTSITDGAVVKAKLASDSVDATKLENGAVTKDKLAAASVDSTKLDTASSGTTNQVLARNTSVASGIEWQTAAAGFTMPAGIVVPYAGASSPAGWLFCDGTAVSRTTYAALFSAIGTTYGSGNGSTTFTLPNTGSKFIAGKGSVGWSNALTDTGGSEIAVTVSHTHIYPHTHSGSTTLGEGAHTHLLDVDHNAAAYGSSGGIGITTSSPDATRTVASNNSAHQHSFSTDNLSSSTVPPPSTAISTTNTANLPPYLTMNYIIKT
jgi:microcystin-dependent protein